MVLDTGQYGAECCYLGDLHSDALRVLAVSRDWASEGLHIMIDHALGH